MKTDPHCGVARGPAKRAPSDGPIDVAAVVARALAEELAGRHEGVHRTAVGASYKLHATVEAVGVTFLPAEVSVTYRVTEKPDPTPAQRRSWAAALRSWKGDPQTYAVVEHDGWAFVRVIHPWKAMRRMVADVLGEEFEQQLPLAMAHPRPARGPLSAAALRLMAGKIASRDQGDVPVEAMGEVARAVGWGWARGVVGREAQERLDGDKHPVLRDISSHPRAGMRLGGGRLMLWNYDRSLTEADKADVLARMRREPLDVDGEVDLPPGSLTYVSASLVPDTEKSPILFGWGHDVLIIEGLRVATPAWVATDDRGVKHFLFDVPALYPRPKPKPGHAFRGFARRAKPPEVELVEPGPFWSRAYRAGLGAASDAVLASFGEDELERIMYRMQVRDFGNTGECQLCARVQKLRVVGIPGTKVLVDHGYHYPDSQGYRSGILGQREGSCEGVGAQPYEKSCEFLRNVILPRQELWLAQADARIEQAAARIAAGEIEVPARWADPRAKQGADAVRVRRGEPGWDRAAAMYMAAAVRDRERVAAYAAWVRRRVDKWQLRPLYDEVASERRAAFAEDVGAST